MNFEEKGKGPLFKIYSETDKKVNLPVYLDEEMYNDNEGYNNVQLEKGLQIQHLPNNAVSQEREIIYCAERSGSGKSYYAKEYFKEYKKKYKNREVFLFIYLTEEDETLKELKVKKFKLDDKFLQANLELDFFKESLVLFDDIEMVSDKAILGKIRQILIKILQVGRHAKISCIYTSHLLTNNVQTKDILNESHTIIIYPSGLAQRNLEYLCTSYLGFDKKDIERIKKIKSRWICFFKSFPIVVAYQTGFFYSR